MIKTALKTVSLCTMFAVPFAQATIVEFNTSEGSFQINLHDSSTPQTVANFLTYVEQGAYDDTVIHRSINNFITQGGGFKVDAEGELEAITTNGTVINEPVWSNVTATISMAKPPSDQNGATSQWFINLVDNSANLDTQNGGFTAFGQVIGDGMDVVNQIAQIPTCGETPLNNYSTDDCAADKTPAIEDYITIYNITIVDSNADTDSNLVKKENTLINTPIDNNTGSSSSGGGAVAALLLIAFGGLFRFVRKQK